MRPVSFIPGAARYGSFLLTLRLPVPAPRAIGTVRTASHALLSKPRAGPHRSSPHILEFRNAFRPELPLIYSGGASATPGNPSRVVPR